MPDNHTVSQQDIKHHTTPLACVQMQTQINSLVIAAGERARRRDMLLGFANDPTGYINGVIATQGREVRERGKGSGALESLRRSQVFQERLVCSRFSIVSVHYLIHDLRKWRKCVCVWGGGGGSNEELESTFCRCAVLA